MAKGGGNFQIDPMEQERQMKRQEEFQLKQMEMMQTQQRETEDRLRADRERERQYALQERAAAAAAKKEKLTIKEASESAIASEMMGQQKGKDTSLQQDSINLAMPTIERPDYESEGRQL